MGTNYYHETNVCEHCGKGENPVHIGKSSAGWTFSWHGTDELRSCSDWFVRLEAGGVIRDEYGDVMRLEDFRNLVEAKRKAPHSHVREARRLWPDMNNWEDEDGCSFSGYEFS